MKTGFLGCAVLVMLGGCGVHQDDWAREFGSALCKHEQECRRVSTSVDCTRPGYWSESPMELVAVREGHLRYSPGDARRCLELISKAGCIDDLKSRLLRSAECRDAFVGTVAEGEPCITYGVSDLEVCGPGLRCLAPQRGGECGTCVATAKQGEEVSNSSSNKLCGVGLYADRDGGMTGPSATAVCQPRRTLGQSCMTFGPQCLEWLECTTSRDPRSEGTCVNGFPFEDAGVGELGEECQQPSPYRPWCAWPATCVPTPINGQNSDGGQPPRCVDLTAKLGEACELFSTQCEANGWCTDGLCTESAQAGESCETKRCAESFTCEDGRCQSAQSVCK